MKKTIGVIMLIIIINCFVIFGSAGESVENELLAVLNDLGTKVNSLVESKYPEGIFDDFYTYEMRIDSPDILAEETSDGKIYARRVNPERLMSFFNEVFIEEISARLLPSPDVPMSRCAVFKYNGSFYQMGGFVGLLREIYIGPDLENCISFSYGSNTTIPYDELTVDGDKAIMKLTLWEPNITGGKDLLGHYDVTFLKTGEGWKVSGGSFPRLFGFINGSTPVNPSTGDRTPSILRYLSAMCLASFVCTAVSFWIAVNRRKKGRLNP